METILGLAIQPQPDDTTCGPTCLQAVYGYFDDAVPLPQLIAEVHPLETGGTLAVYLACHALRRGYRATIYTYNLQLFDPTWFANNGVDLAARLRAQQAAKPGERMRRHTDAYLEFLALGGRLCYRELTGALLRGYLKRNVPILTGLSAPYLYGCAREYRDDYDDVRGEPSGHFVVLCGYDRRAREVLVADPHHENPLFGSTRYTVKVNRVLGAILLGVLTHDANLLVLEPGRRRRGKAHKA